MASSTEELLARIPHLSSHEAADRLGVEPTRIKQLLKERVLLALRQSGTTHILEETLSPLAAGEQYATELRQADSEEPRIVRVTDQPLPNLRGTVLLLEDGGYANEEVVDWLWRENPWLQGRPIDLLRTGHHKAVNRVAATEAW